VLVVTSNDAVLFVVIFQSISEHFEFESSAAAAVAELCLTLVALHVVTARDSLYVNLRPNSSWRFTALAARAGYIMFTLIN